MPPTEKRGRVHTSTVTVAVLDPRTEDTFVIDENDIRIEWFSGTGAGGQHRNRKKCSCKVIHIPTGIIESRQGRHRESNLREATEALQRRLSASMANRDRQETSGIRKQQVGSGMRADKTVTIRFQDDRVQHHVTGKTMKASKYMKGHMDFLWK